MSHTAWGLVFLLAQKDDSIAYRAGYAFGQVLCLLVIAGVIGGIGYAIVRITRGKQSPYPPPGLWVDNGQPPQSPWGAPTQPDPWAQSSAPQPPSPWGTPPQSDPWAQPAQSDPWAQPAQSDPWAKPAQPDPWAKPPDDPGR